MNARGTRVHLALGRYVWPHRGVRLLTATGYRCPRGVCLLTATGYRFPTYYSWVDDDTTTLYITARIVFPILGWVREWLTKPDWSTKMKLGVISQNLLHFETADEGLRYARDLGFNAVEVGACGLWNKRFCNPESLVKDPGEVRRWQDTFAEYELEVSALGGHGAPLMPDTAVAAQYSHEFRTTCQFMEMADVKRITLLAGLPEGAEGDKAPNWVTFAEWPHLRDTLEWQWEKRLLPYWQEHGKIAADHGVSICFEMHGGDMIYTPTHMMRLRDEIGTAACCNFDISHMWYQGIDPSEALRYLGDVVQHVHAKDISLHQHNIRVKGLMDNSTPENPAERSWNYTLSGWGHDQAEWTDFITTLRLVGYDHVISVEMECEFIDVDEGLRKSLAFLKPLVLERPPGAKWWELVGMDRAGGLAVDREEGGS